MKASEFEQISKDILEECKKTLTAGSSEYAGDSDKLANFKDAAKLLGTTPEEVAFIYFYKHATGIARYCRDKKPQRDSIKGRVVDAINYLILIYAVLYESNFGKDQGIGDDRNSNILLKVPSNGAESETSSGKIVSSVLTKEERISLGLSNKRD